jgi:hypothetical protein
MLALHVVDSSKINNFFQMGSFVAFRKSSEIERKTVKSRSGIPCGEVINITV